MSIAKDSRLKVRLYWALATCIVAVVVNCIRVDAAKAANAGRAAAEMGVVSLWRATVIGS
jgi:hypothetical protein